MLIQTAERPEEPMLTTCGINFAEMKEIKVELVILNILYRLFLVQLRPAVWFKTEVGRQEQARSS